MPDAPATTPTPLQVSDADVAAIDAMRTLHAQLRAEVAKVIIGQDQVIEELLIAILSLVFFPQVATWLPNLGNAVAGG